jgi:transposase, IS30 family
MEYCQLTQAERYIIALMRRQKFSMAQIALRLGRHRSTVYRECERNKTTHNGHYGADKAHSYATARRKRSRRKPQHSPQELGKVEALLKRRWSPEQIAGRQSRARKLQISAQTIYRHIRRNRKAGGDLWKYTRIISKFGRKRYKSVDSRGVLKGKRHISERPKAVEARREIGHWEVDTVIGADLRHCLLTMVERATGFSVIKKLTARNKEQATTALLRALAGHKGRIKTMTFDNGTEFHDYKLLEQQFRVKCYFATPYHSWERGSNENLNGLVRQYLPKGMCMKSITQKDCDAIAKELNERPRKRYGYQTPNELYPRS